MGPSHPQPGVRLEQPISEQRNRVARLEPVITKLEQLADVHAVGITDYFSIDGYKKVLEYRRSGRLKNLSLILPNIELRLSNIVYTLQGENKPKRLNVHVLFSELLEPETIEEHFLRQLPFIYLGRPQAQNEVWNASRQQLRILAAESNRSKRRLRGATSP